MAPKIIVSYDGTANDRDALALGQLLARGGAELHLAYVRHMRHDDPARNVLEERRARFMLWSGARSIGTAEAPLHVVLHPSTGEGLWTLAETEGADLIVFGSEYRTPAGSVNPGTSAQRLLEGGPVALAIAPAGLRREAPAVARIGTLAEGDDAVRATAQALADVLGAVVPEPDDGPADLLVFGSRSGTATGHVRLSASTEYALETARRPVLILPRGVPLPFASRHASVA